MILSCEISLVIFVFLVILQGAIKIHFVTLYGTFEEVQQGISPKKEPACNGGKKRKKIQLVFFPIFLHQSQIWNLNFEQNRSGGTETFFPSTVLSSRHHFLLKPLHTFVSLSIFPSYNPLPVFPYVRKCADSRMVLE